MAALEFLALTVLVRIQMRERNNTSPYGLAVLDAMLITLKSWFNSMCGYAINDEMTEAIMPCRVDPTPEEIEAGRERRARDAEAGRTLPKTQQKLNAAESQINWLSVQLDYTRDLVYRMWNTSPDELGVYPTALAAEVEEVLKTQEKHRQADLDRLIKTLGKNPTKKNKDLLKKVLEADITKPLEPQLGFDPDSI